MTESDREGQLAKRDAQWPEAYRPDDEISLFDLWNVLVRQKWVIVTCVLVFGGGAAAYGVFKPDTYAFKTAIEIGSYMAERQDGEVREFVEAPSIVRHKLEEAYVPFVLSNEKEDNGESAVNRINVTTKEDSAVFVLTTEAVPSKSEPIQRAHQSVVELTKRDHDRLTENMREQQQAKIASAQAELDHFTDQRVRTVEQLQLKSQVEDAQRRLSAMADSHKSAMRDMKSKLEAARLRAGNIKGDQYQVKLARLEQQVDSARMKISDLEDQRHLLEQRIGRLADRRELVQSELKDTEGNVQSLQQARAEAMGSAGSGADSLALMMVGAEVDKAEQRLWDLRQTLSVSLPAEQDELRSNLRDNARKLDAAKTDLATQKKELAEFKTAHRQTVQQAESEIAELETRISNAESEYQRSREQQQLKIESLQAQLEKNEADVDMQTTQRKQDIAELKARKDDVRDTEALFVGVRSPTQAGPGLVMLAALGTVLGGMLGVFGAFFREFTQRAREARHRDA